MLGCVCVCACVCLLWGLDIVAQARPAITGLFFTLYVGMIFLVCMNVIIGIVTLYFDEVSPVPPPSPRIQQSFTTSRAFHAPASSHRRGSLVPHNATLATWLPCASAWLCGLCGTSADGVCVRACRCTTS